MKSSVPFTLGIYFPKLQASQFLKHVLCPNPKMLINFKVQNTPNTYNTSHLYMWVTFFGQID